MSMMSLLLEKFRSRGRVAGRSLNDDLTNTQRDALFAWQIGGSDFDKLDADSLVQAGVTTSTHTAKRVLASCHEIGIIDAQTHRPDTTKIDRSMVSKIAIISLAKQRTLVNMLFLWEEEIVRWQLLCSEEDELKQRIGSDLMTADEKRAAEQHLLVVQAKKRIPPSLRDESGRARDAELPSYSA